MLSTPRQKLLSFAKKIQEFLPRHWPRPLQLLQEACGRALAPAISSTEKLFVSLAYTCVHLKLTSSVLLHMDAPVCVSPCSYVACLDIPHTPQWDRHSFVGIFEHFLSAINSKQYTHLLTYLLTKKLWWLELGRNSSASLSHRWGSTGRAMGPVVKLQIYPMMSATQQAEVLLLPSWQPLLTRGAPP